MSDSEFQRQVDAATGAQPQPAPAPKRSFWRRRRRDRAGRRREGLTSESNTQAADDLLRSGEHSGRTATPSSSRHGTDRTSGPVDPYLPSHGFGLGGAAGSAATPGATSGSGATNTLLGVGLLASNPSGSATTAASAETAPGDAVAGSLGDDSTGNRSLFDGGSVGNVTSGGSEVASGVGFGGSGDGSGTGSVDEFGSATTDDGGGSGLLDGIGSGGSGDGGSGDGGSGDGGSGDGGSGLLDGISSGGSGDSGGLLDGLNDASGCFDFGCSGILLLFVVSVSALVYVI